MFRSIASLLSLLLLSACAGTSPPTHFYLLEASTTAPTGQAVPGLSIGLGPVALPDTLDRPQIVTRSGGYAVDLGEFHRWAGNLKANMSRVIATRLMQRLGTERVYLHPWPSYRVLDHEISVDVLQFDGELGGSAVLSGSWTLLDGEGRRQLYLGAFDLREPTATGDHRAMVAAMSRLTERLADLIAAKLAAAATR
jgi:uncharacterized lipoprotein YmbA